MSAQATPKTVVRDIAVRDAIAKIEAVTGRQATYEEIRAEVGGSYRDLTPLIRAFREAQSRAAVLNSNTPAIPDEVQAAFAQIWTSSWQIADGQAAVDRRTHLEESARWRQERRELKDALTAIETERDQVTSALGEAERRLEKMELEGLERERAVLMLEARLAERVEMIAELRNDIANANTAPRMPVEA